ncbi:MAG: 4-hydroxy-tetrahydrodipicolinate reductase [Desulfarculus sp.]|nr:4-hydroxy-tetrahydrodipicolinate reductase [Desulfarculus sp.]
MVRIAVAGVAGRMGGRIVQAIMAREDAALAGGFEAPGHPALGRDVSEVVGQAGAPGQVQADPATVIAQADVLVDFTAPAASLKHLELCAQAGKAAVIGTTGLNAEQKATLAGQARNVPVVFAPNMSVGMNLMFKLVGQMARVLGPDYALELVEAHHDQKKDSPSGTAVRLLEELASARCWNLDQVAKHGRQGLVGARPQEEIGVSVIRGGDIVGDHTVYFIGQGERLELTHRAHSRDTFVQGAVRAALWVAGQQPGLYDMQDVLGLKG